MLKLARSQNYTGQRTEKQPILRFPFLLLLQTLNGKLNTFKLLSTNQPRAIIHQHIKGGGGRTDFKVI
jgi:hypothetical protein